MVRLYLERPGDQMGASDKYVDIYYWSIVKAFIMAWFSFMLIVLIILFLVSFLFGISI